MKAIGYKVPGPIAADAADRKSTRLNSSHGYISYAVFCLKKKTHRLRADRGDGDPPGAAPGGTRPRAGPGGRGRAAPHPPVLLPPSPYIFTAVSPLPLLTP